MRRMTEWISYIPAFLGALFIIVVAWVAWDTFNNPDKE